MTKTKRIPLKTHAFSGGSAGVPGECSAWCDCGIEYAGFESHGEAAALLDRHVVTATAYDRRERPKLLRVARSRAKNRTARTSRRVNRKRGA